MPGQKSKLDDEEILFWKNLFEVLKTFLGLVLIFFGFLAIIYLIKSIVGLVASGTYTFDWEDLLTKFIDLAFIPFLLTFVNYLRLYIVQRPVTVIHERIDAEELFADYFNKVVKRSTRERKLLVIFIDNLDRLQSDKLVEALESLKTYITNKQCIFVVACDDNVVRTVVNDSERIPKIDDIDQDSGRAGEHYLDKFFQQTFRIPEYMGINLHDYARENFETTNLHDKLIAKGVDIRNLISIILPSNISSPRKVKRLLNEFIAFYEIIERRESKSDGQIRPGFLSNNVEFLGKFSTIRAEYPEFYKLLIADSTLLSKVTESLQQKENAEELLIGEKEVPNINLLLSYLMKTQTILVDDLDPYIWLSQDPLALGLSGGQYNQLRTSLADGNIEQATSILESADNDEKRVLLAKVASRLVEQRLVGIEQQNGVKVLSYLLPNFEEEIRSEIALVSASLMAHWPIDTFYTSEIFNVLRWAKRGGIETQRKKLIDNILLRLDNPELRQFTFEEILKNADIVDNNGATEKVQNWLDSILSQEEQTIAKEESSDVDKENQEQVLNKQFAEWLIGQIKSFSENEQVIDWYFSKSLVTYMFDRLLGNFPNIDAVYLDDEGIGTDIQQALSILSNRVKQGAENKYFWEGILQLLEISDNVSDIRYGFERIQELIDQFPLDQTEKFLQGIFVGIENLIPPKNTTEPQFDNLVGLTPEANKLAILICRQKDKSLDNDLTNNLRSTVSNLVLVEQIQSEMIEFIEQFSREFGREDSEVFISGAVQALEKDNKVNVPLVDMLVRINEFLNDDNRTSIIKKIDVLINSNTPEQINEAIKFLEKVGQIKNYQEELSNYSENWLSHFGPDVIPLFRSKINLYALLIKLNLVEADRFIEISIPHFPFAGNPEQLNSLMEGFENIKEGISESAGAQLTQSIVAHINQFGPATIKAMKMAVNWVNLVEESIRTNYNSVISREFNNAPSEYFPILDILWSELTTSQIEEHILQFYSNDLPSEFHTARNKSTINGLAAVSENERSNLTQEIYSQLVDQGKPADTFLSSAKRCLPIDELLTLRQNAMNIVRDNGVSPQSEKGLRLLVATIREDTRDLMPNVDLFANLFGRGPEDVKLALKYVVPCIQPLNIQSEHKHKLAEAMGQAALRTEDKAINDEIHEKASQLGLKWFWYRKHWG